MATGINIPIASDSTDFIKGVQKGEVALEGLGDTLDAVDKAGGRAGDSLEQDFKGAQKATKSFNDTVSDGDQALRSVSAASKYATKQVSNDFELSTREQTKLRKEAIKEIGAEAKANAAETFSSFDGSAQSFVDGIQGTLGGLVGSLGPIGLAAGAAGALAIGLVNGALGKADATSQAFKQDVSDLTTAFIQNGDLGVAATDRLIANLQKLAAETDSNKQSLSKISTEAKSTEQDFSKLADAFAGDPAAVKQAIKLTNDAIEADKQLAAGKLQGGTAVSRQEQIAAQARQTAAQQQLSDLQAIDDKNKAASANEALYAQTSAAANALKAGAIKQVDTAYDEAAGAVDDYVDSETGVFDTDRYISAMETKQKALEDYQATLASSGLTAAAKTFLEAQGADAAATLLAGYKSGTPAQQAALAQIWNEAGATSSAAYTKALQAGIPATIPGPQVVVQVPSMKDVWLKAQSDLDSFGPLKSGYVTAAAAGKRLP